MACPLCSLLFIQLLRISDEMAGLLAVCGVFSSFLPRLASSFRCFSHVLVQPFYWLVSPVVFHLPFLSSLLSWTFFLCVPPPLLLSGSGTFLASLFLSLLLGVLLASLSPVLPSLMSHSFPVLCLCLLSYCCFSSFTLSLMLFQPLYLFHGIPKLFL